MQLALVATDLDGTFLGEGGQAHPENMAAARELVAGGIPFVVATGRPRRWLEVLDPLVELDPIVIASNGGSVGRLSSLEPDIIHPLPPASMMSFIDALPADLEACFAAEYALEWGREEAYPAGMIRIDGGLIAARDELVSHGPVIKLLVHSRRVNTEQLAEVARAAAGEQLTCTFSWSHEFGTVEVSASGISKGTALAEVLAERGLPAAHCVAFGDMPNDLEMLRLVGHPYVMRDSHPSMLTHGFTVIGHHADGAVGTKIRELLDS